MTAGIDGVGSFADEAEQDGAIGSVSVAGEGERAVEIDGDVRDVCELACRVERASEAQRGSHGTDGMRAGGADADLEELEEAGVHGDHCRRGVKRCVGACLVCRCLFCDFCASVS